jgi:hypothetical protein
MTTDNRTNLERRTSRSASAQPVRRSRFGLNSKRAHPPIPPRGCAASSAAPANSKRARFQFSARSSGPTWRNLPPRPAGTATVVERLSFTVRSGFQWERSDA